MRLQVHAARRERLHAVVRETDRLTVAKQGEVARLKVRLAPTLALPLPAVADMRLTPLCRLDSLIV